MLSFQGRGLPSWRPRAASADQPRITRHPVRSAGLLLCAVAAAGFGSQAWAQEEAERLFAEQTAADKSAAASQARIDQLQDQAQDMAGKYRQALTDRDSLREYNEKLAEQVKSQAGRLSDIQGQLSEIETTQRDVLPLMSKMVDTLDQFVKLDVPFLADERAQRVEKLKSIMGEAGISTSEKYRRILEAYQIEMEYGRTLDAYEGTLEADGAKKTVQFVRVGRVALLYTTPDGEEAGYWDIEQKAWVEDGDYVRDVQMALKVATKQGAPDLLFVPIPAPKAEAQQ
jgi:hypothetical protein